MESDIQITERNYYSNISILTKDGDNVNIAVDDSGIITVKCKTGLMDFRIVNNHEIKILLPEYKRL